MNNLRFAWHSQRYESFCTKVTNRKSWFWRLGTTIFKLTGVNQFCELIHFCQTTIMAVLCSMVYCMSAVLFVLFISMVRGISKWTINFAMTTTAARAFAGIPIWNQLLKIYFVLGKVIFHSFFVQKLVFICWFIRNICSAIYWSWQESSLGFLVWNRANYFLYKKWTLIS